MGAGVAVGVAVGDGVGVDCVWAKSPLHLMSRTVLGSLFTPSLTLKTCQV